KEVKSNITDNESAKMTTSKGTIQGYNGVATVDKKHQIIIDAQACVFQTKVATDSRRSLPPIPRESCH
ncbi:MAG: hypothetical protein ACPHQ9_16430, partial [Marinobacter sp.]